MPKQTHKLRALGDVSAVLAGSSTDADAGRKLGVHRSSVGRWRKAGKVKALRQGPQPRPSDVPPAAPAATVLTPDAWAAAIRRDYVLTTTEDALVDLAQRALALTQDATAAPALRLLAMGRYQQLVRQLELEKPNGAITTAQSPGYPRRVG